MYKVRALHRYDISQPRFRHIWHERLGKHLVACVPLAYLTTFPLTTKRVMSSTQLTTIDLPKLCMCKI